ncbi:MATE family efflux transporter [Anaerosphaera multitolerans]|uniref:Multidrug export protein MepA n=1 Tax=Anaerosphaera multitolerans TaxID=2487351 RepID=A0A437S5B3_9FIRM|nr:MATE family efflux transporter [Anaerosphaera multitolerans]RVU54200.1 MATE family efflux transporter [Anaerosphaera multitolerans]
MKKNFYKFVLPSMLAFAFSGLYSIVDGLFIGRNVGDAGLSAINFSYPLVVLIQATGTGIGLGGAVGMSISLGKKDIHTERKYLGSTLSLLAIACIFLTAFLLLFSKPILVIFGAEGTILKYSMEYLFWIVLGSSFQILANGFSPIIRNLRRPNLAMIAMILGFIINIVLDWLFVSVLKYGMAGAAWATIIGQFATLLPLTPFLYKFVRQLHPDDFKPIKKLRSSIVRIGLSPFGLAVAPYVILIMMNKFSVIYGGVKAVAAYSVVSYVVSFIQLLLQGIGDGCQPLISMYTGEKDTDGAIQIRNLAYKFSFIVAASYAFLVFLLRRQIPVVFGASSDVALITTKILPIFCITFLFYSFTRITTSYFYATNKNRLSYLIIYGEPVFILILLNFILPPLLGIDGVWLSIPTAQLAAVILGALFIVKMDKHR